MMKKIEEGSFMEHLKRRSRRQRGLGTRPAAVLGTAVLLVAAGAIGTARPAAAATASCEQFAGASLPGNGAVTAAVSFPAGSFTSPGTTTTYPNLPAFCRVSATLRPTPDSNINVEVWLPQGTAWNGRFVGTGNGGYAGAINYAELAGALQLGFAVANTDMGTAPSTALDGKPIIGHPERWIDWGYRSTHLMTVAAKRVVQAFYGSVAAYSYFAGCSTGGGQGLHEAQQFPDDYDGILAGAPAENRTHLHTEIIWPYVVSHRTPDSLIPPDKTQLITNAVLAACATQSGGLPSDRYLTEPRACGWDPEQLLCQEGANDTSQCLTPAQVDTAQMLYDGPRDPRTGHLIYPGVPRGSESGSTFDWAFLQGLSPALPATEPLFDALFYWAFGPNWDWRSFDFDRNVFQLDDVLARILNANNPDLTRFRAHGGKLLGFHGWADALVPPQDFINYYLRVGAWLSILDRDPALPEASNFASSVAENFRVNSVTESELGVRAWGGTVTDSSVDNRPVQEFFRLFMVPGMGHCGGGPGPNQFYNATLSPAPADAQHNALLALQRWVEQGVAPKQIIATKYVNDTPTQGVAQTRPLCVFPQVARYGGQGDENDAASFDCVMDGDQANPLPPPKFLK